MTAMILMALASAPQSLNVEFVGSGFTRRIGSYAPVRGEMSDDRGGITSTPTMSSPKYGKITFGSKSFAFALDDLEGAEAKLYVDADGNGVIAESERAEWTFGANNMYNGTAKIVLGPGMVGTINLYRFDKNDKAREALKNTILYYSDFGFAGKGTFGTQTHNVLVAGLPSATSTVFIDRNGNGRNDGPSESYRVGTLFNIGGTTYVINFADGKLGLEKSDKGVMEIPLPPDLTVGKKAPEFKAKLMSGKEISFPSSYKGKVVLVDFWATWCGPCIEELPNVVENYEKYHDKGLEILSVSFDQENKAEHVAAFAKEHKMNWDHIYEGKYWNTAIGTQYNVRGIPMMLLVDGTTGEILASSPRGEQLGKAIEAALSR